MRVLLIENDLEAGRKLLSALRGAEYGVDWVRDGESGRNAMASAYYAVVLLNASVPRLGGIDFLKASRAAGNRIPVLLLTAHDDPGMRARALDTGADDCLLKPLDSREVLARIRAVLRRARQAMRHRASATACSISTSTSERSAITASNRRSRRANSP